jgi:hypothetical protein
MSKIFRRSSCQKASDGTDRAHRIADFDEPGRAIRQVTCRFPITFGDQWELPLGRTAQRQAGAGRITGRGHRRPRLYREANLNGHPTGCGFVCQEGAKWLHAVR